MIITASILGLSSLFAAATTATTVSTGAVLGGIGLGSIGLGAAAKAGASLTAKATAKTVAKKVAIAAAEQAVSSAARNAMERDQVIYYEGDDEDYDEEERSASFFSNFAKTAAKIASIDGKQISTVDGIKQKLTDDQLRSLEELLQDNE